MRRKIFSCTGDFLTDMFKKDIIYIENNKPLPYDAKFVKVDVNRRTNTIIVEYTSEKNDDVVEGAQSDYHVLIQYIKTVFRKVLK